MEILEAGDLFGKRRDGMMLYFSPGRPLRTSLKTRMCEGLYALAAARRRRLLAFAMLDQKGRIGHRIMVFPR